MRNHFPKFEMLDARIASPLNKIMQNSYFKKKVSPEEQKSQKEDRFLRGRQIAYMIFYCFRVIGAQDAVLDCADLFSVILRNDDVQEFDTRWDEILLSKTKIPPDDILESLYKLRIRESDQLKTVLELYDMELHQKRSRPDDQKLKTMVKRRKDQKLRLRNFRRQKWQNWNRCSGYESQGIKWYWKRKRNLLSVESKRAVFERRPMQFLAWQRWAWKTDTKNRSILCATNTELEVRREKGASETEASLGSPTDSLQKLLEKALAVNYLVTIGILPPSVHFKKWETGCKFGEEGWWQKCSGSFERCATVELCISGQNRWNLHRFHGRVKKSWGQVDEYDSEKLRSVMITSEKAKVHRSEKCMSKILISAVRTQQNLRIGLRRRLKDRSDVPAETRGDWPRTP